MECLQVHGHKLGSLTGIRAGSLTVAIARDDSILIDPTKAEEEVVDQIEIETLLCEKCFVGGNSCDVFCVWCLARDHQ